MTAHVAEARENSGRVLIWLEPAERCSSPSFAAAARLASAFGAFVETVVVGDYELPPSNDVPLARVATEAIGRAGENGDIGDHTNIYPLATRRQQRMAAEAATRTGVTARHSHATGDPIDRLDDMCRQYGPWNIVVIARARGAGMGQTVSTILANVNGATGVLAAGQNAGTASDDIVVVVEDSERLPSFLRAAERLRRGKGCIRLLLLSDTRAALAGLEDAARLAVAGHSDVVFAPPVVSFGAEGAMSDGLCRQKAACVLARFGGSAVSSGREFERLIALAKSPFLLVR